MYLVALKIFIFITIPYQVSLLAHTGHQPLQPHPPSWSAEQKPVHNTQTPHTFTRRWMQHVLYNLCLLIC
jgi:hypothetical protein